ncbi:LysR family transcriptional regulator [Megasphaera massiliensis]|uniref:LysR family transcriptional regulator n=1 Tax=Megasphaera massiliensis TaxID=1232428 RepID=UPI003AF0C78D
MEFRVLKYFLAVARTENISHAAEAMHVSQPALSRQLMDLEEELGVKLLVRGNRNTTLTEAGFLLKKGSLSNVGVPTKSSTANGRE